MVASSMVLAHQGGWDEMLLVALPVGILVVLLKVANARADRLARDEAPVTPSEDS